MAAPASAAAMGPPFLGGLTTLTGITSTVPSNGDVNPYGVAIVPRSVGSLVAGDTLVSNFNNKENLQGTGSTIDQISPSGEVSTFAEITPASLEGRECPGGIGLTTALAALPGGNVVVGSLPTTNGKSATMQAGCLIVVNSMGKPIETIANGPINGPWDLTSSNFFGGLVTVLYVSNVLNGTVAAEPATVNGGTVVRIVLVNLPGVAPKVVLENVIATGFPERTDEGALVVGPTGLAVSGNSLMHQTLYVNDTDQNRIAEVPNALLRFAPATGGGATVTQGGDISDPLGMTLAPNGNILTANGENAKIVETAPNGKEVASFATEVGPGGLFGLAITPNKQAITLVNDNLNELDLLH
jgi:hypothetical protein